MTDLQIKNKLSKHLGAPQKAINPKDPQFHEKRAAAYEEWYPKFAAMKQQAENEGLTILEYFEKYHIKQPKKQKAKKKKFVPPDPIAELIETIVVPADLTKEEVERIEETIKNTPTSELTIQEIFPADNTPLIAEKEAALEDEEVEYPCPHCQRIYATERAYKRHITMKHPEVHE